MPKTHGKNKESEKLSIDNSDKEAYADCLSATQFLVEISIIFVALTYLYLKINAYPNADIAQFNYYYLVVLYICCYLAISINKNNIIQYPSIARLLKTSIICTDILLVIVLSMIAQIEFITNHTGASIGGLYVNTLMVILIIAAYILPLIILVISFTPKEITELIRRIKG